MVGHFTGYCHVIGNMETTSLEKVLSCHWKMETTSLEKVLSCHWKYGDDFIGKGTVMSLEIWRRLHWKRYLETAKIRWEQPNGYIR